MHPPAVSTPFDKRATCPNCGAPMTFKFAKARSQVCKYCNFLIARADGNWQAQGRVADLAVLPSPFEVGSEGTWNGEPFHVEGRVQLDRASAPGAPWQEFFLWFHTTDRWCWIAHAQGRWYSTTEMENPGPLPPIGSLRPGITVQLAGGAFQIVEVGQRRVVSGEGELPDVATPGVTTGYADFGAPGGVFGTIDYGDGRTIPPKLFLGRQVDPAGIKVAGAPIEQAEVEVQGVQCPNCGGSLPLVTPGTTERIVCKYCGTVSDVAQGGALSALAQAPKPPMEPYVPLGQEGNLRGMRVICIGFVIRGTTVDGTRYRWREYLVYAGPSTGYLWLMEEDGVWSLVTPIPPGEVRAEGSTATCRGRAYHFKQSVSAQVEYVVGEFYWKVEVGESVQATEYAGPGGKVSVEQSPTEVNHSFVEPLSPAELGQAFGIAPPAGPSAVAQYFSPDSSSSGSSFGGSSLGTVIFVLIFILFAMAQACDDCEGSGGGGGVYIGPGFGGK